MVWAKKRTFSLGAACGRLGSRQSFRRFSSNDRFKRPNVQESGHAAENGEIFAFREWLLPEGGQACPAAPPQVRSEPTLSDAAVWTNVR